MIKEFKIDPELTCFRGHFPGSPVMPAVSIIDTTIDVIRETVEKKLELREVKSAKFMHAIRPGMNIRIELNQINESRWKAQWKSVALDQGVLLVDLDIDLSCT
jgi:3-hydroxymyristoyl/3-hydroxydecanoyl-(acyl carrier protein) dehydratase